MITIPSTLSHTIAALLCVAMCAGPGLAATDQHGSATPVGVSDAEVAACHKRVKAAEERLVENCTDAERQQRVTELAAALDQLAKTARTGGKWKLCYGTERRLDRIAHIRQARDSAESRKALDSEIRIVLFDGQMFHGYVSDVSAAESERIALVDRLEEYIVEEHRLGLYLAVASSLPPQDAGKLQRITADRDRYHRAMAAAGTSDRREPFRDQYLETFAAEAELWREQGHAAQAILVLDHARQDEISFGRGGSERSMFDFRYRHAVDQAVTTGVALLHLLHRADFTLQAKQRILADLRECIEKDLFIHDE